MINNLIRIGYACLNTEKELSGFKTCRLCNVTENRLVELIRNNLDLLDKIIDYNIEHQIELFRISSDIIPFGSSSVNTLKWDELFKYKFDKIGEKIKEHNIRVSMHPGQYTVINSPNVQVVEKSINDLIYHSKVLDTLSTDKTCKIILHIGGSYGDKKNSIKRFIDTYNKLPTSIKDRLVIENDDKIYNIEEVLYISNKISCPVVFDNLHNKINPPQPIRIEFEWIELCNMTWKESDGRQKIHYSQQNLAKNPGAHSDTIETAEFLKFCESLKNKNIDIMLEVKDKNKSALKCNECLLKKNLKMITIS